MNESKKNLKLVHNNKVDKALLERIDLFRERVVQGDVTGVILIGINESPALYFAFTKEVSAHTVVSALETAKLRFMRYFEFI